MTDAVSMFLQMSLQGAVLIAALLALRAVFARRIAPGVLYALWLIPAARLLIPGSIESAFSFQNLVSEETARQARVVMDQGAAVTLPVQNLSPVAPAPEGLPEGAQVSVQSTAFLSLPDILFLVWFVGLCAVLAVMIWKNIAFARRLKADRVEVETECPLPVYLSGAIASPCLCGLLRPAIYVDERTLQSQQALDLVLRHEMGHCRAGDRFWALLRLVCCVVHWFNPLVWIAAAVSLQDCERACDARVLRRADEAERQTYGVLLLSYLQRPEKQHLLRAASSMGGGKGALRGRIALIARSPEMKKAAVAALALCVALTCLVACTTRIAPEAELPSSEVYQKLARNADDIEFVSFNYITEENLYMTISGKTLARYLDSVSWTPLEGMNHIEGETVLRYNLMTASGQGNSITFIRVQGEDGEQYYAHVTWRDPETDERAQAWYAVSTRDLNYAWAMTQIGGGDDLECTLSDGSEFVMICSGTAMGRQEHYLFYGVEEPPSHRDFGVTYTPIYGDLDEQYARVAENMLFISRNVGFVSFRYENDETAPDLFRTADGGKTWQRVVLPMGDIDAESGYSGMHVTEIDFEDEKSGTLTVGMKHAGTTSDLAVLFTTTDGGETWWGVTSGGPDMSGVRVTLYVGNDNADGLEQTDAYLDALTPENLVDALISAGGIPKGTKVLSFDRSADGMQLTLNLSKAFATGVGRMGTAGESVMLGSLVNTFLDAYDAQILVLQIEGKPLETGHNVYEEPFGYFIFDESGVSWDDTTADAAAAMRGRVPAAAMESERIFSELVAGITLGAENCSDTGDISFTIPEDLAEPKKLTIYITGRQKMGDENAMSRHFLEGVEWTAGETYTFNIGDKESYLSLSADIYYSYNGTYEHETTVDLRAHLPG